MGLSSYVNAESALFWEFISQSMRTLMGVSYNSVPFLLLGSSRQGAGGAGAGTVGPLPTPIFHVLPHTGYAGTSQTQAHGHV